MGTPFDLSHYKLGFLESSSPHRKTLLISRENYQDLREDIKKKSSDIKHRLFVKVEIGPFDGL